MNGRGHAGRRPVQVTDRRGSTRRHSSSTRPPAHPPGRRTGHAARRVVARRAATRAAPPVIEFRVGDTRKRMRFVVNLFAGACAVVLAYCIWLQTGGSEPLLQDGRSQRVRESVIVAQRGTIFARDGGELAISVPSSTVYADPRMVVDGPSTVASLTAVLGLSTTKQQSLLDSFAAAEKKAFVYVARQIDDELAAVVLSLDLEGVGVIEEERRIMPSGEVGRSVLGLTNVDGEGIAGLEKQYEEILRGIDGARMRERDREGRSLPGASSTTVAPIPGTDLVLTIDRSLQFQVETALLSRVEELKAKGGTVVIMDTATGDIYSMANVTRNEFDEVEVSSANLAAVEAFDPGSVAKVFSVAAVIDAGVATPDSTVEVPGSMTFNEGTQWEQEVHDAKPHGLQTMSLRQIVVDSSNIGTLLMAQRVGNTTLGEYLAGFGFGTRTAVDFPDESAGIIKDAEDWQGAEAATISYGYGYTASSLQLAAAVNTVANGGVYVAPRLLAATIDPSGTFAEEPASATRRVVSPESAATVTDMLRDVVCSGTGRDARIDEMSVAGKTGTSYKLQGGGYGDATNRIYRASFVGFFPAQAPRVTILVTIDEPDPTSNDRFGGKAAAPLFARLARAAIHELAIMPVAGDTGCDGR
ncbi:MAG: peptidoglycan synthetase FtsI [Actinomycetota bacterium]